ncbi:MAG: hypothetical protein ABII23_08555 [bacterium]
MRKAVALVLGCVLMLGSMQVYAFEKGMNELAPTFSFVNADDADTMSLGLAYGYFFTSNHEGKLILDYSKTEVGLSDISGGYLGLGYEYNFIDVSMDHLPFLGGGINFPLSDYGDLYDRILFIQGGFKSFFVPEKAAFRSSLSIERFFGSDNIDDSTAMALRFGLVIFFEPIKFQKKSSLKKASTKKSTATKSKRKRKGR